MSRTLFIIPLLLLSACVSFEEQPRWMKVHVACYTGILKIYEADVYQSLTDPSVRYHLKTVQLMSPPMNSVCAAEKILD